MTSDALTLGSFLLTDPSGSAWKAGVEAEGTSRGAPVPIEQAVNTFLQDGSIVVTQGYDNREVNIRVRMWATSLTALSSAEAALFAELGKPNLLTWTPTSGPAAVFRVVTSSMVHDDQTGNADLLAATRLIRSYNVRLLCEAFPQSAVEVVATALSASGTTTTLVNDGSATTSWTGFVNGGSTAPSVVSGAVKVTSTSLSGAVTCSLVYTASITTSSTKYLVVDWKPESNWGGPDLRAFGDGVELNRVANAASPTAGFTRTWFGPVAASSIAVLRLDSLSTVSPDLSVVRSLSIDNINRTDVKPTLGSARQLMRSIPVVGSARTQGSIAIEHASSSLGDVLAYFFPDTPESVAYSPPLRQYRNAAVSTSTVTTDSTLVSGAREVITALNVGWDIPAANLISGLHLFMPRVTTSSTASVTFTWSAQTVIGGSQVFATGGTYVTTVTTGSYVNIPMARIILPNNDASTAAPTTVVRLTLIAASAATVTLDEAWLFNTEKGDLVQASCGVGTAASGGPARRMWIKPATVTTPRPTVRVGHAADQSDAYYPNNNVVSLNAWQFPQFPPDRVNVLTVTSNALDASVTLSHFPRWHTNPAS